MDHLRGDVRFGLRSVSRSPLFAFTVILTLGLGIGANTAIFSFVDALLLRPLPSALCGAGIVIGVLTALALSRTLTALLFEISPTDPATFLAIVLLLTAVSLFACWLPARRAAGVRPIEALRKE